MDPNPMSTEAFNLLVWVAPISILVALAVYDYWSSRKSQKTARQHLRHRGHSPR